MFASRPTEGFVPSTLRPPRLLLVVGGVRRDSVRRNVARLIPTAQVDALDDVVEAVLLCARRPPDLVLLDHGVDGGAAPAVVSNLARVAPDCRVLAFDEPGGPGETRPGHVRGWDELDIALRDWLRSFERQAAGASRQALEDVGSGPCG